MEFPLSKFIYAFFMVALLGACASGVKLNEVPIEDKSGTAVSPPPAPAPEVKPAPEAKSAVAPVNTVTADNLSAGPSGVTKVIYFDYDSYMVKAEFQSAIEGHAQFLKANPRAKLSLEGHTDERGGREYNLALGQKRADAVRQSLSLLGVTAAQVETVSFGEEKPAVAGSDEAAFSKNRRAEFFYK
ncbi:MAG: peptidoglycan-associated lipoprotein Pal [Betaproteobacteria bacterium]|nr:peptidoglycan-associated lipoprotein Pal [Betaproteobacteria bacterium]